MIAATSSGVTWARKHSRRIQVDLEHLDLIVRIEAPSVDNLAVHGDERCDAEGPTRGHYGTLILKPRVKVESAPSLRPDEGLLVPPFDGKANDDSAVVRDIQSSQGHTAETARAADRAHTLAVTPNPRFVTELVAFAHDCSSVRAHGVRLAVETTIIGGDQLLDAVNPLRGCPQAV